MRLQHKVSASLKQALEKLKLTENAVETKGESRILPPPNLFLLSTPVSAVSHFHHRIKTLGVDRKVMLTVKVNG